MVACTPRIRMFAKFLLHGVVSRRSRCPVARLSMWRYDANRIMKQIPNRWSNESIAELFRAMPSRDRGRLTVNLLSATRIALCLPLLLVDAMTLPFWVLYLIAGVTDMLDGFLARRWGVESHFGARLDSVADFVFACYAVDYDRAYRTGESQQCR